MKNHDKTTQVTSKVPSKSTAVISAAVSETDPLLLVRYRAAYITDEHIQQETSISRRCVSKQIKYHIPI